MNSKVARYLTESLAASGCAVVNSQIAYRHRPDTWATPTNCGGDFSFTPTKLSQIIQRLGAALYDVDFADGTSAPVAARSTHMLAERIEWLTGRAVLAIRPYMALSPVANATRSMTPRQQERMERLKQLAAQEPPAHDCALRREILAAREKVSRLEAGGNT